MTELKSSLHLAEKAMLMAISISLCLALWGQSGQAALADDLVRLHVIAHSDSEGEQRLKLRVRDAVLEYLEPLLENAENAAGAEELLRNNLPAIEKAAASAAEGRSVRVRLVTEAYPTRHYATFSLPAGEYRSLQILLGDAAGRNWWCVAFPPLCSAAASDQAAQTLGEGRRGMIHQQGGYVLRFRCAELWEELRLALGGE